MSKGTCAQPSKGGKSAKTFHDYSVAWLREPYTDILADAACEKFEGILILFLGWMLTTEVYRSSVENFITFWNVFLKLCHFFWTSV